MVSSDSKILVTGGTGFLGKHVVKKLKEKYLEVYPIGSGICDLTNRSDTRRMMQHYRPNVIVHLAGSVGGIGANRDQPGKFFYDNMMMGMNIIDESRLFHIDKLVMVGTVCSYPKFAVSPFKEEEIWEGYPEETNAPYGIAKKSLYEMIKSYRQQYKLNGVVVIPTNLFGPNDNFDPKTSHVIPAIILKMHNAKQRNEAMVNLWGTGNATREFLYVEDCADAIRNAVDFYSGSKLINIGNGKEVSIKELANKIKEMMDYKGIIIWNHSEPDGQPRRCLDVQRAKDYLNFEAKTSLDEGLKNTIDYFYKEIAK